MRWFNFKTKRVRELESRVFDLERALFESQQFERIASDKLTEWVRKHDELLIRYKQLTAPALGTGAHTTFTP